MNDFFDGEAELSESDAGQFSSDETEDEGPEDDSFINDATQLTQATPLVGRGQKVDMQNIYRQSLFSPLCGALNFHTPAFHTRKNRYKMVFNRRRQKNRESESPSEAEETFARESELEDEVVEAEDHQRNLPCVESYREVDIEAEYQNPIREERSSDEIIIRKQSKLLKRKRILDDSFSEDDFCSNETRENSKTPSRNQWHDQKTAKVNSSPKLPSRDQNSGDRGDAQSYQDFKTFSKGKPSSSTDIVKSTTILGNSGSAGLSSRSVTPEKQSRKQNVSTKPNPSYEVQPKVDRVSKLKDTSALLSPDWCGDVSDAEFLHAVDLTENANLSSYRNKKRLVDAIISFICSNFCLLFTNQ